MPGGEEGGAWNIEWVGDLADYAEKVGEGVIVVYGFDALHRHQNHGNHALVWNALLNWNDLTGS